MEAVLRSRWAGVSKRSLRLHRARKEDRVSLNFSHQADRKIAKTSLDWIRMRREQPGRRGLFEGFPQALREACVLEGYTSWSEEQASTPD